MDNRPSESNSEEIKKYLAKCEAFIAEVNAGTMSEEAAGYEIVQMSLHTEPSPISHPLLEDIFDAAADLEIPRIDSYKQPMGSWDSKTADSIKREEWERLIIAIQKARVMVGY